MHNKATSEQSSTPYKFTSKELDEETGLYYYGHRYLDPKLSDWISADPPLAKGDYFPVQPINDKAKERNSKLPGMGGVFNSINLDAYQYAGRNPVKLIDPDGKWTLQIGAGSDASIGASGTASGGLTIGFSFKKGFQLGTYGTFGYGGQGDVGVSGTIEIGVSNNTDINDLGGVSVTSGFTVDAGAVAIASGIMVSPTGGGDVSIPVDDKLKNTYSLKGGLSSSVSPFEAHGYKTTTKVNDFKIQEKAKNISNQIKENAKSVWGKLWK